MGEGWQASCDLRFQDITATPNGCCVVTNLGYGGYHISIIRICCVLLKSAPRFNPRSTLPSLHTGSARERPAILPSSLPHRLCWALCYIRTTGTSSTSRALSYSVWSVLYVVLVCGCCDEFVFAVRSRGFEIVDHCADQLDAER
jgi:hypothetical protein